MDAEYANYYTREVMLILIREFQSPDEEMKKIVLKVRDGKNNLIAFNPRLPATHSRLFNHHMVSSGLVVRYMNTNMRIIRGGNSVLSVLTLHPLVTLKNNAVCLNSDI